MSTVWNGATYCDVVGLGLCDYFNLNDIDLSKVPFPQKCRKANDHLAPEIVKLSCLLSSHQI